MNTLQEITINYTPSTKFAERIKVEKSKDAVAYFKSIWSDRLNYIEECYMLLLNKGNQVLGYTKISIGGTSGTVVDVKVVYQAALKSNAHGIIIAHNHPSGNLKASNEDIKITKAVKEAGRLLDISLLDHIVLTNEGYLSLADEGIL